MSAIIATIAACTVALLAVPAAGAPSSSSTAADQVAVERAVAQYEAVHARAEEIDARIAQSSEDLDTALAAEAQARQLLQHRVNAIYRAPDSDMVSMLLGATTLQNFVARWDMLSRIARQDAANLKALRQARQKAERSAKELLALQAEQAKALDATEAELARAKKELAASQAAVTAYTARTTSRAKRSTVASDPTQKLTGSGAWKTGVASHYGRNFTGRGANGEAIGPYTMMVAHKTLPFGTLIEFEYNGKRCVAKVADRGPHSPGRDFDLGPGVVRVLGFSGVHEVRYRIIGR